MGGGAHPSRRIRTDEADLSPSAPPRPKPLPPSPQMSHFATMLWPFSPSPQMFYSGMALWLEGEPVELFPELASTLQSCNPIRYVLKPRHPAPPNPSRVPPPQDFAYALASPTLMATLLKTGLANPLAEGDSN